MQAYRDPTAWQAIANADREARRKQKQKQDAYVSAQDAQRRKERIQAVNYRPDLTERNSGLYVAFNRAEWFCAELRRVQRENTDGAG